MTCLRCDGPVGIGVVAFRRLGHKFIPTGFKFCLQCGGNGANVLTAEEESQLPTTTER